MTAASDDHALRLKRLHYRANHRGMRELDMLVGQFADDRVPGMTPDEAAVFEALLAVEEPDLMAWIIGTAPVPAEHDTPLFRQMMSYAGRLSAEKL